MLEMIFATMQNLKTDYNKTLTSLTDKVENMTEIMPKVKEKKKPKEINLSG